MPRKPILAAASIVIGSTGAADAHLGADDIICTSADEDALIAIGGDPIHLDLDLGAFGSDGEIGIDYAQTYWGGGGGGGDGVTREPSRTPKLQDRVQTQQPLVNQPKLQTQPSVQGADQQPRKKRLRKKRVRK